MADHKHTIRGPGAADFLTAPGGEDLPETSPDKGDLAVKGESHFTNPRNLEPQLEPNEREAPQEGAPVTDKDTGGD